MPSASRTGPRVAVVATASGGPAPLARLLESLAAQSAPPAAVVVADRTAGPDAAAVVAEHAGRLPVRRIASAGSVSAARNDGLAELGLYDRSAHARPSGIRVLESILAAEARGGGTATATLPETPDLLVFPDEGAWYAEDAFALAADAVARGCDAVSGRLLDPAGTPVRPAAGPDRRPLDARTVWTHAPGGACFFTAGYLRAVGGFDENLGPGGRSPWHSGAGTDLLLRGLRRGATVVYDPRVRVHERPAALDEAALRAEARHAARGTGRVHRRHYGGYACTRAIVRPLGTALLAAARGRWSETARHLHEAVGRAEGVYDVLLPAPAPPGAAVTRPAR
ncbi:glycosyltransferase family 2 protein [Actinomadura parmotrematis]|uniref:Glycosyltransferase family 2 protein n=1 Tax=Actinomadura parmotrematis TaxID=2864039 RepID=A0ABS7FM52_9ACTN|nr:hypothetical protein [Actinomadura parmotrematis]MBW8481458.1 hypothetical protein [Actinomadura parmotrematis]